MAQTTAADPKKLSNKPDVLGKYKEVGKRDDKAIANMGSLGRVNFKDALKRVAMVVHQHVVKIERRYSTRSKENENSGLFHTNKLSLFCESNYATPSYQHTTVRVPTLPGGAFFVAKPVKKTFAVPETSEIYDFMYQLFRKVQLSSECSVVCLIYVERLMERGNVPLMAKTWRPILMCGLLLASKVWQDLSSWNIEVRGGRGGGRFCAISCDLPPTQLTHVFLSSPPCTRSFPSLASTLSSARSYRR